MDIRLKIGRYAGEIRDIPAIEAKLMLTDGRAEDPRMPFADGGEVELAEPYIVGSGRGPAVKAKKPAKTHKR